MIDSRGPGFAGLGLGDGVDQVEKYEMPTAQYEGLTDSVLHWKRTNRLGRFDPNAKSGEEVEAERREKDEAEVRRKGVQVGKRCRVNKTDEKRGKVRFVGEVDGLGGEGGKGALWVGVVLDEPVGRIDGSVVVGDKGERKRLFECKEGYGLLARPEKVEIGEEWVELDDLGAAEDMEEL